MVDDNKQPTPAAKPAKASLRRNVKVLVRLGAMVCYVMPGGGTRPGVVVAKQGSVLNLQVFTDGANDGPEFSSGIYWATDVKRDTARAPGTWHTAEEG